MFAVGRPGAIAALLTLAAFLFGATHVPPTGPLGAACFLMAALVLEFTLTSSVRDLPSETPTTRLEPSR
jgi:hypothetical protein